MSNERDILIRALEASGSQREAELARAILPDAPPAQSPAAPIAGAVPADPATPAALVVAAEGAPSDPQPFTLADYDRMSPDRQREFALTDEGDAAIAAALRREG